MSRKEGFLDRWSRLKEAGDAPEVETPEAEPSPAAAAAVDERSDAEILAELGLPDPDDLTLGDDVAGFMSKSVPDRLRRRALRQLWRANPVLANLDGLVEYGEDYTDSAMVVENLQTLYQVGKGMFVEPDVADEAEEGDDAPSEVAEPESETQETDDTPEIADASNESEVAAGADDQAEVAEVADAIAEPTRKRMVFS